MKRIALILSFAVAAVLPAAWGQTLGARTGGTGRSVPGSATPSQLGRQAITPLNRSTRRITPGMVGSANRTRTMNPTREPELPRLNQIGPGTIGTTAPMPTPSTRAPMPGGGIGGRF
jgi:hypothetical protein